MSTAHCTKCGHLFPDRSADGNAIGIKVRIYADGSGLCRQCYREVLPDDES